jgi:hypothetical protein
MKKRLGIPPSDFIVSTFPSNIPGPVFELVIVVSTFGLSLAKLSTENIRSRLTAIFLVKKYSIPAPPSKPIEKEDLLIFVSVIFVVIVTSVADFGDVSGSVSVIFISVPKLPKLKFNPARIEMFEYPNFLMGYLPKPPNPILNNEAEISAVVVDLGKEVVGRPAT